MPPFYPSDLDAYFSPIGVRVVEFVEEQGLTLEKYHHDSATWSLCFGHPNGGQAKVELAAVGPDEIQVSAVWWVDDYKSFTRSLRWGPSVRVPRKATEIRLAIEGVFAEALKWTPGSWTQVAGGYQPYWSEFTEEEFRSFANPWPLPRGAR
jgi:hypothetical protein